MLDVQHNICFNSHQIENFDQLVIQSYGVLYFLLKIGKPVLSFSIIYYQIIAPLFVQIVFNLYVKKVFENLNFLQIFFLFSFAKLCTKSSHYHEMRKHKLRCTRRWQSFFVFTNISNRLFFKDQFISNFMQPQNKSSTF